MSKKRWFVFEAPSGNRYAFASREGGAVLGGVYVGYFDETCDWQKGCPKLRGVTPSTRATLEEVNA